MGDYFVYIFGGVDGLSAFELINWSYGWEDRALQQCNLSAQFVRGLRMHPIPAVAQAAAGSFFGLLRNHGTKRKTDRSSFGKAANILPGTLL